MVKLLTALPYAHPVVAEELVVAVGEHLVCRGIESGECGVAWSVERNVLGSDAEGVEQNERWERDGQDHDRV